MRNKQIQDNIGTSYVGHLRYEGKTIQKTRGNITYVQKFLTRVHG